MPNGFHTRGGTTMYTRNISNATNTTSCLKDVNTILPLTGDGGNNFFTRNAIVDGRVTFEPSYHTKGGIILHRIHPDSYIECRITFINLTQANTEAVFKVFLVFDYNNPTGGIYINSSPTTIKSNKEQTVFLSFFGGGLGAIYPVIEPAANVDIQTRGFLVSVLENR